MDHNRFRCGCCAMSWGKVDIHSPLHWTPSVLLLFLATASRTCCVWPRMQYTDSHACCCSGELPNVAGMFGQLRVFNITSNLLAGALPQTFGAAGIFTLVRT